MSTLKESTREQSIKHEAEQAQGATEAQRQRGCCVPGGVLFELPHSAAVLCIPSAHHPITAPGGEGAEARVERNGVDGEDLLHLPNLASVALECKLFGV